MAHFAELSDSNEVLRVVVINNSELLVKGKESEAKGIEFLQSLYGHNRWRQTSYSSSFRQQFAAIGDLYDPDTDVFVTPAT